MALSNSWITSSLSPSYDHRRPSGWSLVHGKHDVRCHTLNTLSTQHSISKTISKDLKTEFIQVYGSLKSDIFHDPSFEFDDHSRQWVERMLDYNVPGGKLNRGVSVVDTYKLLKGQELITDKEFFLASALGWCIEWFQAYGLVTDDIIDGSYLRRGHPCWFRLPEVGMIAVNDALIIRNHIAIILKKHFKGKDYYVDLLELFNEAEYQSIAGQMIDMITNVEKVNILEWSMSTNRRIHRYKTSYYSFYLPVACALLMYGENLSNHVQIKDILVEMGIYFTVQDDYLDIFGDSKLVGKKGLDIGSGKCTWLAVKALELANDEQKKLLNENYGKKDAAKVSKVEKLYDSLNLQGVYKDYENKTYQKLITSIEAQPNKAMQEVLKTFLRKIYKRQK